MHSKREEQIAAEHMSVQSWVDKSHAVKCVGFNHIHDAMPSLIMEPCGPI